MFFINVFAEPKNAKIRLAVKFFPPDPGQLQEEYTRSEFWRMCKMGQCIHPAIINWPLSCSFRYLFAMQIKRDLAEERLVCSDNTSALLISLLLQCEYSDYIFMVMDLESVCDCVPRMVLASSATVYFVCIVLLSLLVISSYSLYSVYPR